MVKTKPRLPSGPGMTAFRCCAACLHAIVAPDEPLDVDGQWFHLGHAPATTDLTPPMAAADVSVRFLEVTDDLEVAA